MPQRRAIKPVPNTLYRADTSTTELQVLERMLSPLLARAKVVALAADNSPLWLAAERCCATEQRTCVPLPHFFTAEQKLWALDSAGVDTVLTDYADASFWQAAGFTQTEHVVEGLTHWVRDNQQKPLPLNTAKITFTSGSTGTPKGVCLSQAAQDAVALSIADVMVAHNVKKHLCVLPLAVLLENVAGAQAALQAGATCVVPALTDIGWQGSSHWDAHLFLNFVATHRIESFILLPQMLKALLPLLPHSDISSVKLAAVGGARVAPELLTEARKHGLPVYEGYGLSECASVVCLNRADADKSGTVGKPLPHAKIRISDIGELEVASSARFLGYLNQADNDQDWWPTGDLASVDKEGLITIHGRRKHIIISSYGRNISPEWVESALLVQPGIFQAAVFGEARPWLMAVLFAPSLSDAQLSDAVIAANHTLPDYAQIKHFLRTDEAFTTTNGCATSNGRNRRDNIAAVYDAAIHHLYRQHEVNLYDKLL